MKQPRVKSAFSWAFLALFGCISVLGQGWHALFEHAHHGAHALAGSVDTAPGSGTDGAPTEHCHPATAAGHEHHDHGSHAALAQASDGARPAFSSAGLADAHHCPICDFFSLAQWTTPALMELASARAWGVIRPTTTDWLSVYVTCYDSRGPPQPAVLL